MMRTYQIFGDIEGKLKMPRVECTRCPRKGRYSVAKLIAKPTTNPRPKRLQAAHRRALALLSDSPEGATAATMLAHGFKLELPRKRDW
jgi:hypothetical protein